jgi:hypothetical protein
MKERPILFSGPMVRAILEGRKTQTRRVVKPQPYIHADVDLVPLAEQLEDWRNKYPCPYGQPGDRLWVKEKFSTRERDNDPTPTGIWYWADGQVKYGNWTRPKPSIHMPRWASRIALEITKVRVERLDEITPSDVEAEGCGWFEWAGHPEWPPTAGFAQLWDNINAVRGFRWDKNPWVWVVEFKKI